MPDLNSLYYTDMSVEISLRPREDSVEVEPVTQREPEEVEATPEAAQDH